MNKIQLKQGNSYIFTKSNSVLKGEILEQTKTTYLIKWETGNSVRYLIEDFDYEYNAIEEFNKFDDFLENKTMQNSLKRGDIVLCTFGFNKVLNEPFSFLYEFGYYTEDGCVVYKQGEQNMQDAHFFNLEQVKLASDDDLKNNFYGS